MADKKRKEIAQKKLVTRCKNCNGFGHWAGDDACPMKEKREDGQAFVSDVFVAKSFYDAPVEKAILRHGACDTACNRTVAGQAWLDDYIKMLKERGLPFWIVPCREKFRFGSGEPVQCNTAFYVPITAFGGNGILRISAVPGRLPMLLGKDALRKLEARIDLKLNTGCFPGITKSGPQKLEESKAGHLMLPLLPDEGWQAKEGWEPNENEKVVTIFDDMLEAMRAERVAASRTARDMLLLSGSESYHGLHRVFRRLRRKKQEEASQAEEALLGTGRNHPDNVALLGKGRSHPTPTDHVPSCRVDWEPPPLRDRYHGSPGDRKNSLGNHGCYRAGESRQRGMGKLALVLTALLAAATAGQTTRGEHRHQKADTREDWSCNLSALEDVGWFGEGNTRSMPLKKGTRMLMDARLRDWRTLGASPAAMHDAMAVVTSQVMEEEAQEEHEEAPASKRSRQREPEPRRSINTGASRSTRPRTQSGSQHADDSRQSGDTAEPSQKKARLHKTRKSLETELKPMSIPDMFRSSDRPVVGEIFTHVENVKRAAERKQYPSMRSYSLEF